MAWARPPRWPAMFAYQVWEWTRSAPVSSAATARSTPRTANGGGPAGAGHDSTARTSMDGSGGRGAPKHRTATSIRFASSRDRYSTWTPAPPYTSGGYSRVTRVIRTLRAAPRAGLDAGGEPGRVRRED